MDLSNFSKSLPLSIEPTEDAINILNKEISDEFKCGARSIAALYRLSNTKNQLFMAKGYMDCLNDLSKLIESEQPVSVKDVKDFIYCKRKDLNPSSLEKEKDTKSEITHKAQDEIIPNKVTSTTETNVTAIPTNNAALNAHHSLSEFNDSYKFTLNYPSNHHFPKSRVPLSIDHSNLKCYKSTKAAKKISDHSSEEEIEETDNELDHDGSDLSFDEITELLSKRKINDSTLTTHKKPKL